MSHNSKDYNRRVHRRALLKYAIVGGALVLSDVFPGRTSLDLLTKAYGKPASSISIQQTTSADAYQLITQALAAGQTQIHLPAGNYSVSNEIDVRVPNVEIYGDGQSATILRLNNNVYGSNSNPQPANVLNFSNFADNFHVHDLQIDGNAANNYFMGNIATPYSMCGVFSYNCDGGVVERCFIHDCRFEGVQIQLGSNCIVKDNIIMNIGANGITVNDSVNNTQRGRGGGHQVLNNTVNGASDVGISVFSGIGSLIDGNDVSNITLGISPYTQNTCDGIICEGKDPCENVRVSNNSVHDISSPTTKYNGTGFWGCPDGSSNIQVINNRFQNVYAAMRLVGSVTGLVVTGNTVNGTTSLAQPIIWVDYNPRSNAPIGTDIENNTIQGVAASMTAFIINLFAGSGKFINNTIYTNGNKPIRVENSINWVSSPNTITTGPGMSTPIPTLLLSAPSSGSQGQPTQLAITVFNPTNSLLNATVMVEIIGPDNYLMFDVVQLNVTAASQSTVYYVWTAPNQSGTFSAMVNLSPSTSSGFSTATIQIS